MLREPRLPRPRPGLSGIRGRGRGAQRRPVAHRGPQVPEIIEHLEAVVGELESPPILMGHSAGGVFTQLLLDRGYGAVGVAINSAPTEGVKLVPLSQIRSTFPVLKNPANRHKAVGFTFEQWHYAFTNTFSEEEARSSTSATTSRRRARLLGQRAREHPSGPRRQARQLQEPRPGAAPLHLGQRGPPHASVVQRSNAKHYKAEHVTEVKEFEGRAHLCPPRTAGKRSPTTRSTGPSSTPSPGRRRRVSSTG